MKNSPAPAAFFPTRTLTGRYLLSFIIAAYSKSLQDLTH